MNLFKMLKTACSTAEWILEKRQDSFNVTFTSRSQLHLLVVELQLRWDKTRGVIASFLQRYALTSIWHTRSIFDLYFYVILWSDSQAINPSHNCHQFLSTGFVSVHVTEFLSHFWLSVLIIFKYLISYLNEWKILYFTFKNKVARIQKSTQMLEETSGDCFHLILWYENGCHISSSISCNKALSFCFLN